MRQERLTEAPYLARQARLGELIRKLPAEPAGLLITNPKDVGYLTGFLGGDSYLLVPADVGGSTSAVPTLISDFRYKEELGPVEAGGLARVYIRSRSMSDAVVEVLGDFAGTHGGRSPRIGLQAEHMTVAEKAAISRRLAGRKGGDQSGGSPSDGGGGGGREGGGGVRLVDTAGLVAELRGIKDAFEIGLIRKAARIQEQALQAVLPTIKPGQIELEIAARLEMEMKSRGSDEPGFQTIVASGASGSLPHYRPGSRKLTAGKPVLVDWGAVFRGYHADMTRVFTFGKWHPKLREIYGVVLDAHLAAAAALGPGKSTAEIDGVARKLITKAGYGEFFGHGLGHGLGLAGHEAPRLTNTLAPTRLCAGMVLTIEPGIYLPGIGGVRIEDDYLVTDAGAENLCTLKKDPDWSVL